MAVIDVFEGVRIAFRWFRMIFGPTVLSLALHLHCILCTSATLVVEGLWGCVFHLRGKVFLLSIGPGGQACAYYAVVVQSVQSTPELPPEDLSYPTLPGIGLRLHGGLVAGCHKVLCATRWFDAAVTAVLEAAAQVRVIFIEQLAILADCRESFLGGAVGERIQQFVNSHRS